MTTPGSLTSAFRDIHGEVSIPSHRPRRPHTRETPGSLSLAGQPVDDNTPRENFTTHNDYILYCQDGYVHSPDLEWYSDMLLTAFVSPRLTIRFGHRGPNRTFTSVAKTTESRKLLLDQSRTLRVCFSGGWIETRNNTIDLDIDDVTPDTFIRLTTVIKAGGAILGMSGGLPRGDDDMTGWVRAYVLADYWYMDGAKDLLRACIIRSIEYLELHLAHRGSVSAWSRMGL